MIIYIHLYVYIVYFHAWYCNCWTLPKIIYQIIPSTGGSLICHTAVKRWTVGLGTWRCLRSLTAALGIAATGGTPSHWARLPGAGEDWRLVVRYISGVTIIRWLWSQGWALMYCKFFKLVDFWQARIVCVAHQVEAQPYEETSRKTRNSHSWHPMAVSHSPLDNSCRWKMFLPSSWRLATRCKSSLARRCTWEGSKSYSDLVFPVMQDSRMKFQEWTYPTVDFPTSFKTLFIFNLLKTGTIFVIGTVVWLKIIDPDGLD